MELDLDPRKVADSEMCHSHGVISLVEPKATRELADNMYPGKFHQGDHWVVQNIRTPERRAHS